MDTAVEIKNTERDSSSFPPHMLARLPRILQWFFLIFSLIYSAVIFFAVLFSSDWSVQEALVDINLVEEIFGFMFQGFGVFLSGIALAPYHAYRLIYADNELFGLWLKRGREDKLSLSARLLLVALAVPLLGVTLFILVPIIFSLALSLVLWTFAGQLGDSLAMLPGYGNEALKQVLWLVNLYLLHAVICVFMVWMLAKARRERWLGTMQKVLKPVCLGVFLVLYWQFSKHYGVKFAGFFDIYIYDPEVAMGTIAMSLLFLACSLLVVGILFMLSTSLSLGNFERITLRTRLDEKLFEGKRELIAKIVGNVAELATGVLWILIFVQQLGNNYT